MTVRLTTLERRALELIRDSEYHDSPLEPVWVNIIGDYLGGKRRFSGVMASLVKKGLATTNGKTCKLTQAGLDAIGLKQGQ